MKLESKITTNNTALHKALERLGREQVDTSYLTQDEIVKIHNRVIGEFGGSYGIRDDNLLQSVCAKPYQSIFGSDLYPDIFDKAAKYLFDFANYQIFVDGNKRTGLAVCNELLQKNGYILDMSAEKQYFLVMDIANHRITESEQVAKILKGNILFRDGPAYEEDDMEEKFEESEVMHDDETAERED